MTQQNYNENLSQPQGGVFLDSSPNEQPKGTCRFTLNGVERNVVDGKESVVSNENANFACTNFPTGYYPNGDVYLGDNSTFVILSHISNGSNDLGIVDGSDEYVSLINTTILDIDLLHRCQITFRLRRGNDRVVYWTDGKNFPRSLNIDKLYNYYNTTYQNYLSAHNNNPVGFLGEKWEISAFNLIKSYSSIPTFDNVEILETGNILPGSYNFAIQMVDEDLNPTNYITSSGIVRIYNDTTANPYNRIRGSRNIDSSAQSFPRASKTIRLTIGNLDSSFPYYRVAIIRAAGNTGQPEKVLLSDLQSTSESKFSYAGNDGSLSEVSITDILVDKDTIFAPQHNIQLENRLILLNGKEKDVDWCEFQQYASKIKVDLATTPVILNNVNSDPNVKSAKSTFIYGGFLPGEVYSLGAVYVMEDYTLSPSFHIPGKNQLDTVSKMKYHELDTKYLDIHKCADSNYWGLDAKGESLVGKNIRHHRFPFRKEVSKPLISRANASTTLNKYRLKVVFSLNPAYTPGPNTYPVDGSSHPIAIAYTLKYKITGASVDSTYSGILVDTNVSGATQIIIYDDTQALTFESGSKYTAVDSGSALGSYQTGTNDRFIITETYESYNAISDNNTDTAEIFGIELSNIQRPPGTIGILIVRNERLDDDKIVIDNAIFGAMTEFSQYKSFGLVNPKQYYTATNCTGSETPSKTVQYYQNGMWFFNPEFQYFQKKQIFDSVEIEGTFTETSVNMPSISNVEGQACNSGWSKGLYINDVQAGTSYNPDVNKSKSSDDDGFDLLVGYRNTNVAYASDNTINIPDKTNILYLNSAAYYNDDANTYYNVSGDNKIGMYLTDGTISSSLFYNTSTHKNRLLYGSLIKNNTSSYANFLNRPYYKCHNNPFMFGDNEYIVSAKVYGGDASISATNLVSSTYYNMVVADRAKKSRVWKIVLGAVLVVAGVVLAIPSAGASLGLTVAAATALSGLAISYGVSLAVSGIKFEQFKSMIDVDYEKGLKETVSDGGTFECMRESIETADDTIRWFSDRVSNLYMESSVPFGLRCGLTCGVTDFTDAPDNYDEEGFRSYLTEKMTTIDRDQGSGRLYRGFATAEVYDMNLDYTRMNKEKEFIHLPIEYDCCTKDGNTFPDRVWWSEQSFSEEKSDNYRVFLPNNYKDIEGEHGEITGVYKIGVSLFIQTREGLYQLPQNNQERISGEFVTSIGTGEFFSIPPRIVQDDALGTCGTQHKWATVKTPEGVLSISELESKIILHTGSSILTLSSEKFGLKSFFENNMKSFLAQQLLDMMLVRYPSSNAPSSPYTIGYISVHDKVLDRIIITKRDYLILPDKLETLAISGDIPSDDMPFAYDVNTGIFYSNGVPLALTNTDFFENKSFTISFVLSKKKWRGWHSYLPLYYIRKQQSLYSFTDTSTSLWKHNQAEKFQSFYGETKPFIVELVSLTNPLIDSITASCTLSTEARQWDEQRKQFIDVRDTTFNKAIFYNHRQCSGVYNITIKQQMDRLNWLKQQVAFSPDSIKASREATGWQINGFKDNVTDYAQAFFSTDWNAIQEGFYIDKVINESIVNMSKEWQDKENFKGKYLIMRAIFNNFDNNINLLLNYGSFLTSTV